MESGTQKSKARLSHSNRMERRTKIRIQESFGAVVRGMDRNGQKFETDAVLDNLSAGGLYLHLPYDVEEGSKLLLVVQLSNSDGKRAAQQVATHGKVLRSELKSDGRYDLAVKIEHHRFL